MLQSRILEAHSEVPAPLAGGDDETSGEFLERDIPESRGIVAVRDARIDTDHYRLVGSFEQVE